MSSQKTQLRNGYGMLTVEDDETCEVVSVVPHGAPPVRAVGRAPPRARAPPAKVEPKKESKNPVRKTADAFPALGGVVVPRRSVVWGKGDLSDVKVADAAQLAAVNARVRSTRARPAARRERRKSLSDDEMAPEELNDDRAKQSYLRTFCDTRRNDDEEESEDEPVELPVDEDVYESEPDEDVNGLIGAFNAVELAAW